MAKTDTITIYWSEGSLLDPKNPYNMVYRKPESLLSFIHGERTPESTQQQCPAMKDRLNNVFVLKSSFNESFEMDPQDIKETEAIDEACTYYMNTIVAVTKTRPSNLKGYYSMTYNLHWLFFASEPVIMKFTAPYYPSFSPMRGALLATGEFDIGKWYRPVALEYHVPLDEYKFEIRENDPVAFIEFMTDKKIVFKRYEMTEKLASYSIEMGTAPMKYGKNLPLEKRYEVAEEALIPKMILNEIKKNIVE